MNCKINVDIKSLSSDCNEIQRETDAAKSLLKEIETVLAELDGLWSGPAKDAFTSSLRQSLSKAQEAVNAAAALHESLSFALQTYEACANEAESIVAAVERQAAV